MIRSTLAIAAILAVAGPAYAGKCADEIKTLESAAAKSDAAADPGSQKKTGQGMSPAEGGGEASASAKILEAKAHDQRGDEANCMKAVEEAKKTSATQNKG